jgi:hypothetical protein
VTVECRCEQLTWLCGDEADEYAAHLEKVAEQEFQYLMRCPRTGVEWVYDAPIDPAAKEWIGIARLRRFPLTPDE